MRLLYISFALFGIGLTAMGCSYLRPSCDSAVVLDDVRTLLVDDHILDQGNQLNPDVMAWLRKAVQIDVLDEKVDDSGRHLSCTADVTLSEAIASKFKKAFPIATAVSPFGIDEDRVRHGRLQYMVSLNSLYLRSSVKLDTKTEDQQQWIPVARQLLIAGVNETVQKDTVHKNDIPKASANSFHGGEFQRTANSGDLQITPDGSRWHIHVIASAPPEVLSPMCHLEAVGELKGEKIIAHLVPFKSSDEMDEVTAENIHEADNGGDIVLTVSNNKVTIGENPSSSLCARRSDIAGEYTKVP